MTMCVLSSCSTSYFSQLVVIDIQFASQIFIFCVAKYLYFEHNGSKNVYLTIDDTLVYDSKFIVYSYSIQSLDDDLATVGHRQGIEILSKLYLRLLCMKD